MYTIAYRNFVCRDIILLNWIDWLKSNWSLACSLLIEFVVSYLTMKSDFLRNIKVASLLLYTWHIRFKSQAERWIENWQQRFQLWDNQSDAARVLLLANQRKRLLWRHTCKHGTADGSTLAQINKATLQGKTSRTAWKLRDLSRFLPIFS